MSVSATIADVDVRRLRSATYNGQVLDFIHIHENLAILRVLPDHGAPNFQPGQYSVLGLGNWERRVEGVQDENLDEEVVRKLLKRAYSFSCPMLDPDGRLLPPSACRFLEFYIVLIRQGERHPPGLTPRLFALNEGDRLFIGPKATGHYTLSGVQPNDDCVFVGTGTGEAPHNAMVAQLLSNNHRGRIVTITCVRKRQDLAYLSAHRQLESKYANYKYITLTTREPENLDPRVPGFTGRRYLQDYFDSGDFTHKSDLSLNPEHTHVFLCGNPIMIGAPKRAGEARPFPKLIGMVEILIQRGFQIDQPKRQGNIHFEKYW